MINSFCTIYLVRHAQSESNANHFNISKNPALTIEGKIQAEKLKKEFQNINFTKIYSSDLIRAIKTAEILFPKRSIEINTSFREKNGLMNKIINKFKIDKENSSSKEYSDKELLSNLLITLKDISIKNSENNILIVSHGYLITLLLIHLKYLTQPLLFYKTLSNTGYVILKSDGNNFKISSVVGMRDRVFN